MGKTFYYMQPLVAMIGVLSLTVFCAMFEYNFKAESLIPFCFGVTCIISSIVFKIAFAPVPYRGRHFK
ncbi:MAG: hypothetical protein IKF17_02930 [Clostridia bacterium]|nr:hypothetical protein [Clostridia bacterium]